VETAFPSCEKRRQKSRQRLWGLGIGKKVYDFGYLCVHLDDKRRELSSVDQFQSPSIRVDAANYAAVRDGGRWKI
jgi:hypothetical protein